VPNSSRSLAVCAVALAPCDGPAGGGIRARTALVHPNRGLAENGSRMPARCRLTGGRFPFRWPLALPLCLAATSGDASYPKSPFWGTPAPDTSMRACNSGLRPFGRLPLPAPDTAGLHKPPASVRTNRPDGAVPDRDFPSSNLLLNSSFESDRSDITGSIPLERG